MLSPKEFVKTSLLKLENYISGITDGSIISNELECGAVKIFLKHRKQFIWKQSELERVLKFFSLLNISNQNTIQQIELLDFQIFWLANFYALYRNETTRLYDQAYIEIAKKNGKTSFFAGLSIYECIADGELNANCLMVASSREQARIALSYTDSIIINSPALEGHFKINRNIIYNKQEKTTNKIEVKAADASKIQGLNTSFSLIDEFAFHKNSELQQKIKSGMIARKNHLQVIITTACNDKQSPAFTLRETCVNILKGKESSKNIFTQIFTLDDKKEAETKQSLLANIRKANPAIGHIFSIDQIEKAFESASMLKDTLNTFYTDNLNLWIDNLTTTWIEDNVITALMQDNKQIPLGAEIVIGLDLSANSDLTSIGLLHFDRKTETFVSKVINIFPNNTKTVIRKGSVDLTGWFKPENCTVTSTGTTDVLFNSKESGYIIRGQLETLDETLVIDLIKLINERYKVVSLGYDPWNSSIIVQKIEQQLGINCNQVRQNIQSLNFPLRQMETALLNGRFFMEFNPVVRWNFQNVALYSDINGNRKINKKGREAVDSIISLIVCMHEFLAYNYSNLDFLAEQLKKIN